MAAARRFGYRLWSRPLPGGRDVPFARLLSGTTSPTLPPLVFLPSKRLFTGPAGPFLLPEWLRGREKEWGRDIPLMRQGRAAVCPRARDHPKGVSMQTGGRKVETKAGDTMFDLSTPDLFSLYTTVSRCFIWGLSSDLAIVLGFFSVAYSLEI